MLTLLPLLLPYFQAVLAIGNICIMLYALKTFISKPHLSLEEKVNEHEVKIKDIEKSLLQGNDRFRDQEATNEVMQSCMLALIDFELSYCIHTSYEDTEDLTKARDVLRRHLARK